jgi:hypothetical protein
MSLKTTWYRDKLRNKSKRGVQGYPIATVTCYGPDDKYASKVVVGIIMVEGGEVEFLERWFPESMDARLDPEIAEGIVRFIQQHSAKTVVSPDGILGCPHEEGIDYPDGEKCRQCPFWTSRDRFTGETIQ